MNVISRFEKKSTSNLSKVYTDYYAGGVEREITIKKNLLAYENIQLLPRVLRGEFRGDLDVHLCDGDFPLPIIAAPTAFHKLAHPEGECGTARAVAKCGSAMIVSMASNTPVEEICKVAFEINSHASIWQQIYIQPDRKFTLDIVRRAEASGCKGLVITVDSPVFGIRDRDLSNGFSCLPEGLTCPMMKDASGVERDIEFDSNLSWSDISWLQKNTDLPIVLKGILHPEDIRLACAQGIEAVMVSNHGGRQLDGVPATIHLLPILAKAAEDKIPLILDGGIRYGTDILKALALGATAVAVGRPIIWGLASEGQQGVEEVLNYLYGGLLNAAQLCGCESKKDINPRIIYQG